MSPEGPKRENFEDSRWKTRSQSKTMGTYSNHERAPGNPAHVSNNIVVRKIWDNFLNRIPLASRYLFVFSPQLWAQERTQNYVGNSWKQETVNLRGGNQGAGTCIEEDLGMWCCEKERRIAIHLCWSTNYLEWGWREKMCPCWPECWTWSHAKTVVKERVKGISTARSVYCSFSFERSFIVLQLAYYYASKIIYTITVIW